MLKEKVRLLDAGMYLLVYEREALQMKGERCDDADVRRFHARVRPRLSALRAERTLEL